jgi:cytochrome c556
MTLRITTCLFVFGLSSAALAHSAATGIVKERMDGMLVISKAMKTILAETQSDIPDPEVLKEAARAIEDHAGEAMTKRFPKGSMDHPTEAKETIWENWDRFSFLAQQLDMKAKGLALAAGNPKTGKPAELTGNRMLMDFATMGPDEVFTLLGKNCTACHTDFRVKKK